MKLNVGVFEKEAIQIMSDWDRVKSTIMKLSKCFPWRDTELIEDELERFEKYIADIFGRLNPKEPREKGKQASSDGARDEVLNRLGELEVNIESIRDFLSL